MKKVLVTSTFPGDGLDRLSKSCQVELLDHSQVNKDTIIRHIKDKDGLICLLTDSIDQEVIAAAPNLKGIANYAVGFNNIDLQAATSRNILVTNTPGVLTESSADLTWALLMSCARRIVESDRFVRAGRFTGWEPELMLGMDVFGKTLGIIGAGRIGQAVARRALGFSMKTVYYNRNRLPQEVESELKLHYTPLNELLASSDFISLHCPLSEETHHLIGREQLDLLKPHAVLVNTARGPVVDEAALVEYLQAKRIFGAAFDVYEHEPALTEGLDQLSNVVLAPHIASASHQTRARIGDMAVDNLLSVLAGERPTNLVNTDVWIESL